jgi:hypothetical protein
MELDEDNFQEKIDLGFDIRNSSQLRYFLSSVYLIKAKAEGLVLINFDSEDSMACKNWTIDIDYDLNIRDGITVKQAIEYDEIPCKDEWRSLVFQQELPNAEDPVRQNVAKRDSGSLLHKLHISCLQFVDVLLHRDSSRQQLKVSQAQQTKSCQETVDATKKKQVFVPGEQELGAYCNPNGHG